MGHFVRYVRTLVNAIGGLFLNNTISRCKGRVRQPVFCLHYKREVRNAEQE